MSTEKKQSVGGIWVKTINTKNGPMEIMSISIGDKRFTAWPNSYKQPGDKSPDFKIMVDEYKPQQPQQPQQAQRSRFAQANNDLPF